MARRISRRDRAWRLHCLSVTNASRAILSNPAVARGACGSQTLPHDGPALTSSTCHVRPCGYLRRPQWNPGVAQRRLRAMHSRTIVATGIRTIGHEVAGCVRPAPSASIVFGLGRRGGVVGKPRFQLGFNLNEIVVLGLEVARMGPLEARLELASDPPIGIAEMIIDGRILGLELNRTLELLDGLLDVAEPVIGPAEGVDDVTIVGARRDRALDHAHAGVEIDALVDPRIAEIVEHVRLIGKELERLLEIGLRARPLLGAFEADAAEIIDHPVRLLGLADGVDALGIDVRTFRELLASA